MATFLLYWNPHFSSYKLDRFLNDFRFPAGKDMLTDADSWDRSPDMFNWSIIEHEKAHEGDRFFFVRVGYEKPTGIVGAGHFRSEPYADEDWSGQSRKTFYMDMDFDTVINPTSAGILSTAALAAAIPEIDWTRGRAGVEVPSETAAKIETIWEAHINSVK